METAEKKEVIFLKQNKGTILFSGLYMYMDP